MIQDNIDLAVNSLVVLNPYRREIVLPLSRALFDQYKLETNRVTIANDTQCIYNYNYNDTVLVIRIIYNNFGESPVTSANYYMG